MIPTVLGYYPAFRCCGCSFCSLSGFFQSGYLKCSLVDWKDVIKSRRKNLIYVTDGNIMYLTDASRFLISCVIQHYAPVLGWGGWRNRCIMLMDLSWRQTLSLPPPGIEPGSPASQAGTLPQELSRQLIPVLRIRDFYHRSRIRIFSHPGSWIQNSNKREGWKKISCHNFLCSHKFHKIANYFSYELLKKKNYIIIELFNQNCQ